MQVFVLVLGLTILYLAATNKLYKITDIILSPQTPINTPMQRKGAR